MTHYHAFATCGQHKYLVIRQFRKQRNTASLRGGKAFSWGLVISRVRKAEPEFPEKLSVLFGGSKDIQAPHFPTSGKAS